jgi:hypothetical protein
LAGKRVQKKENRMDGMKNKKYRKAVFSKNGGKNGKRKKKTHLVFFRAAEKVSVPHADQASQLRSCFCDLFSGRCGRLDFSCPSLLV